VRLPQRLTDPTNQIRPRSTRVGEYWPDVVTLWRESRFRVIAQGAFTTGMPVRVTHMEDGDGPRHGSSPGPYSTERHG